MIDFKKRYFEWHGCRVYNLKGGRIGVTRGNEYMEFNNLDDAINTILFIEEEEYYQRKDANLA